SSTAALIRTPPPPVATTARAYRGARERGRPPAWCARPWLPAERARARVLRGEANRYGDAAEHDRRDTAASSLALVWPPGGPTTTPASASSGRSTRSASDSSDGPGRSRTSARRFEVTRGSTRPSGF